VEYYDDMSEIEKELFEINLKRIQKIVNNYANLQSEETIFGIITSENKVKSVIMNPTKEGFSFIETYSIFELEDTNKIFKIFDKKYCQFTLSDSKLARIINIEPLKYCCDSLKKSFSICSQHGLLCPDYYIRYDSRDYFIRAINATYKIDYCPYCGKYLY